MNNFRPMITERDGIPVTTSRVVAEQFSKQHGHVLRDIEELISQYEVSSIVLGLPKNMNNTEGERAEKTKEFGEMLERRTGLPVILWDERLTTAAAEQVLMESGVRRENRKAVIDQVAACLILQGYLDRMSREQEREHGREEDHIGG